MKNISMESMTKEELLIEYKILENFVKNIAYRHSSNQYFQSGTVKAMAKMTLDRINHIRNVGDIK